MQPAPAAGQLRWRCRRGMKELDAMLTAWLEQRWGTASSDQRRVFVEFLELPDPLIARYLLGRETPIDQQQRELVAALIGARAANAPDHRS
jgi:antitoxin CptB